MQTTICDICGSDVHSFFPLKREWQTRAVQDVCQPCHKEAVERLNATRWKDSERRRVAFTKIIDAMAKEYA